MAPPTGALVIALLQLSDTIAPGDREVVARRMLDSAKKQGADVALLPELWGMAADGDASTSPYATMASTFGMAIGVPYDPDATTSTYTGSNGVNTTPTNSSARSAVALFGMNGSLALTYVVKRGDPEGTPTCGDGRGATTTLVTAKGAVTVGVMLGTEFMFMQPARVQMVRGTEVLLNAVRLAGGIDPNHPYFEALQQDNFLYYAHANYASVKGRAAGGSGGGRMSQVAANATAQLVLLNVDLDGLRESRLTAGMWDGGFDFLSRRPFNYQPLCYAKSRSAHHAAAAGAGAGAGGGGGDGSSQGKLNAMTRTNSSDGPVVRVAVLQMNAVDVPDGVDPVQAHTDRATTFVKLAKAKGADIVVFPEQWSVGYSRNWDHWKVPHYYDPDSNAAVYSGYAAWAQRKDGPYVTHFRSLAKELGIAIAAAYTENVDGQPEPGDVQPPRNSVAVIDRNGELLHNYAKVHIAWSGASGDVDPEGITQPGRGFHTSALDLGDGRGSISVCSFICFDREHPESAAMCAAGGAELILHPTACGMPIQTVRKVAARAMYNGVSIAMANFGNSTDNVKSSWGHSVVVNATGHMLVLAPDVPVPKEPGLEVGEGVFVADIDIGAQRRYRSSDRGVAATTQPLAPELCRVPLARQYFQSHYDVGRMWL